MASKKRISCSAIYSIYLYFLSKRFYTCAQYLSKTVVHGLISFLTTYLRLAYAELKFLLTFASLPFRSNRFKLFQQASRLWLEKIRDLLQPAWLTNILQQRTKRGILKALLAVAFKVLVFVHSCICLKYLAVLLFCEFMRVKRIVMKTVNRTRSIRVQDSSPEE